MEGNKILIWGLAILLIISLAFNFGITGQIVTSSQLTSTQSIGSLGSVGTFGGYCLAPVTWRPTWKGVTCRDFTTTSQCRTAGCNGGITSGGFCPCGDGRQIPTELCTSSTCADCCRYG